MRAVHCLRSMLLWLAREGLATWEESVSHNLARLSPRDKVTRLEIRARAWLSHTAALVAGDCSVRRHSLDVQPEGGGGRHVCEGLPVGRNIIVVPGYQGNDLGGLPPCDIVVRAAWEAGQGLHHKEAVTFALD